VYGEVLVIRSFANTDCDHSRCIIAIRRRRKSVDAMLGRNQIEGLTSQCSISSFEHPLSSPLCTWMDRALLWMKVGSESGRKLGFYAGRRDAFRKWTMVKVKVKVEVKVRANKTKSVRGDTVALTSDLQLNTELGWRQFM